jgi:copper chaperone CopZ
MISASIAYNIVSGNMQKSLDRVASQATVKRDAEYYEENINKVKDVDDFLGNYRLYSYAMTAYGLDDMTYAKAFMKKVLESDLTDANSFANKLSDSRYKEFAAAFNFSTPAADAQSDAQEDDLIGLYTQSFADEGKNADAETKYYGTAIDKVQNVAELVGNTRLRTFVLKAYGVDPTYVSKDFLTQVLTSDLNDPTSFVNVNGNDKYKALAAQFNFNADGTVTGAAQTATQKDAVMEQYTLTVPSVVTQAAADYNKSYYLSKIGAVTSVDDLLADKRLTSYIKTAFSMGADFSNAALKEVLTDRTYAQSLDFDAVYQAFNFKSDGSLGSTARPQTAAQTDSVVAQATGKSSDYANKIAGGTITTVDDLIADKKTTAFIKDAYGLAPDFSDADLKSILTDAAYATSVGHSDINAAFNFQADGTLTGPKVQSDTQLNATIGKVGSNGSYFSAAVGDFGNVDQLLADTRVNSYLRNAYGVSSTTSDADLKTILTDPSAAATMGFSSLHEAFNFTSTGGLAASYGTQTSDQMAAMAVRAKGVDSYYQTNIVKITNVDDLIANSGLTSYIKNAFGMPLTLSDTDLKSILTDSSYATLLGYDDVNAAFNFLPDGSVPADVNAQSASQARNTGYQVSANLDHFQNTISTVSNVDQLISDQKLSSFLKSTYGMPVNISDADLKSILTDPTFAAANGFSDVNAAFSFAADGSSVPASGPQTSPQLMDTVNFYDKRYADAQQQEIDDTVANYKKRMTDGNIKKINDFLRTNATADLDTKNDKLADPYQVALRAYGLTEQDVPRSVMRKLLQSDPYDPKGYVASFKDERITNLVRAFNFGSDGKIASEVQALSPAVLAKYATDYKSRALMGMTDGALKDKASKEATAAVDAFAKGMAEVKSLDDFLSNDKLTSLVLKANGLDPKKYDVDTLRKIFTSDPSDKKSYLNTKAESKFKEIVADFNFDTKGELTRAKIGTIQNTGAEDRTQQSFLQQTLETQEGQSNDGVRLALYFSRKAPNITSLYTILGDKALFEVISTTYSLPKGISSMDVDKQVDLLKKFVNLDDLQDPKKVDKLMKRFTAMYDLANNSGTSTALSILTNGGTS